MDTTSATSDVKRRIRSELPSLTDEQVGLLTAILSVLVATFKPEVIYAFGSRARDDASVGSDINLMVVVSESSEPGYRRDQKAYRSIPLARLPIDILVVTRAEFTSRAGVPASLPATVLREGRTLYAA